MAQPIEEGPFMRLRKDDRPVQYIRTVGGSGAYGYDPVVLLAGGGFGTFGTCGFGDEPDCGFPADVAITSAVITIHDDNTTIDAYVYDYENCVDLRKWDGGQLGLSGFKIERQHTTPVLNVDKTKWGNASNDYPATVRAYFAGPDNKCSSRGSQRLRFEFLYHPATGVLCCDGLNWQMQHDPWVPMGVGAIYEGEIHGLFRDPETEEWDWYVLIEVRTFSQVDKEEIRIGESIWKRVRKGPAYL